MTLEKTAKSFGLEPALLEKILGTALGGGGTWAELFFEKTTSTQIVREGGKLERIQEGQDRGVGLRVIFDLKTAYAYTTNLPRIPYSDWRAELRTKCALQQKIEQLRPRPH